jgi:hypothetical protein
MKYIFMNFMFYDEHINGGVNKVFSFIYVFFITLKLIIMVINQLANYEKLKASNRTCHWSGDDHAWLAGLLSMLAFHVFD